MKDQLEREEQEKLSGTRLLREDVKFAAGKIAFFQYFAVAVFVFLISGFWELQVRNPTRYLEQADSYPITDYLPVLDPMPEGMVLDESWEVTTRGQVDGMARDDGAVKRRFIAFSRQRALLFSSSTKSAMKHALNPRQISAREISGSMPRNESNNVVVKNIICRSSG